jgi:iron complex transport system ATP-binding protein
MSATVPILFSCSNIRVEVSGRTLVDALDFEVGRGELLAVLGQNGSGKSLTMHTLAGLRPASQGQVLLDGQDVAASSRRNIAKQLALLPQHIDDIFPATVLDTAMIGRHPHIGRFQWESANDVDIGRAALANQPTTWIPSISLTPCACFVTEPTPAPQSSPACTM